MIESRVRTGPPNDRDLPATGRREECTEEDEAENVTDGSILGYIAPGLSIRGRLSGSGDIEIDGQFDGELELDGNVTILEEGRAKGPFSATSLTVDGRIRGTIRCDRLAVRDGGRVDGDIKSKEISIDDGAIVRGTVEMDFDAPTVDSDGVGKLR